jgi:hypothetical protein
MESRRNVRTNPLLVDVVAVCPLADAAGELTVLAGVVVGAAGFGVVTAGAAVVTTGRRRCSTTARPAGCLGAQAA